ncbi:MAG: patatin-like phospholipase family protein [Gammaproteobacteria bacterium]
MASSDTQSTKLGVALSGGGFRASYFHIGVLAQMAEQGLLRHVEVISTVSGGSIVGALYYLHIKKLLESKPDNEITDQDYVRIVETIETTFKKATDKNIRMLTFASLAANLRFHRADYSRSDRISNLYNELIYRDVLSNVGDPVEMRKLKISPCGTNNQFDLGHDNPGRQAKVPILIINATALNTGRLWQFTAKSMGELTVAKDDQGKPVYDQTDSKPIRLLKADPSYDAIGLDRLKAFRLGHAVGASAGVPALFPPLSISGLYKDDGKDIRVQLVDGGVYDNQGIESLQYEKCTHYVVSDASKQLGVEYQPHTDAAKVIFRGFDGILPDRVRSESLKELFASKGGNNVAFMHLRKGLEIREIAWINANGKPDEENPPEKPPAVRATSSDYGVPPGVQKSLANIRTDLDAFSEVEAFSLMLDGYRMSKSQLEPLGNAFPMKQTETSEEPKKPKWRFKAIEEAVTTAGSAPESAFAKDYLKQLEVGSQLFGKVLRLIPSLLVLNIALLLLLFVLLWPFLLWFLQTTIPTIGIVIILAGILLDKVAKRSEKIFQIFRVLRDPVQFFSRSLLIAAPAAIGTPFVKLYLIFINPLFRWRGRVENIGLSRTKLFSSFWRWAKAGFENE